MGYSGKSTLRRDQLNRAFGSLVMVFGAPPPKPVKLITILAILFSVFNFLCGGVGHVTPSPSLPLLSSLAAT
jgi:hypothetical protein